MFFKGCRLPIRGKVNEGVHTGIRVIDTILPIGRGQRQLLIGDRFTGKTNIYVSTLINHDRMNYLKSIDGFGSRRLFGVYVGIDQDLSRIYKIRYILERFNIFWYVIIIATHTTSPAMLSFLSPYTGTAVAEFLRDNGYDALICYDDFSKQGKVYRQISLIQGRVPGREGYPADVFNIHASLLERCGKTRWYIGDPTLKAPKGNGSITGFPVIETINCDVTEYIATNVISITDGQVYTNAALFKNGFRPAVDSALSVSRVGSSAQFKFLKKIVGTIKNDLTNYRQELENCQIADEEGETEDIRLLKLKGRPIELMFYQDYLDISPIEETVLLLLLYNKGYFNSVTTEEFNSQLLPLLRNIVGKDFIYLKYILTITKNRNDSKIEYLVDTYINYLIAYMYK